MSDKIPGLDAAIRDVLAEHSGCNWWIIKVRDPAKRKNAKPLDVCWSQGDPNVLEAIKNMFDEDPEHFRNGEALDAVTIEARRMTQKEIDKWNRITDRKAKQEEREAERAERNKPLWEVRYDDPS